MLQREWTFEQVRANGVYSNATVMLMDLVLGRRKTVGNKTVGSKLSQLKNFLCQ